MLQKDLLVSISFYFIQDCTRFASTMTFAGTACYISTFLPLVRGCTTVVLYPAFDVTSMAKAIQDERLVFIKIGIKAISS